MNTSNKPGVVATTATDIKSSKPKIVTVLDVIKSKLQSELLPTKKEYVLFGKDGKPECYRAEFAFQGNLRTYLNLQSKASGGTRKFSSLISLTSAGTGADVLAVPASIYVRDTWGRDGTKILQMLDNAMGSTEICEVSTTLTHGCRVAITVHKSHLQLKIRGERTSFAKVIEQICWLVSVAGDTPTARLANYLKETKQGTTTREYAETIYTGRPFIKAEDGYCFDVSFSAARIEKCANQDLVRRPGHCWKTMTGLSIVASGFAIPSRPRHGSGLEASLSVLRQLIRRGCHEMSPRAIDRPLVVFPPRKANRTDESGQVSEIQRLRFILAADAERPLRELGNVIYWHFDPAKVCKNSVESFEQLEIGVRIGPSALDPISRHFVGWSNNAGHLTAAPKDIPLGAHSRCVVCPHYQLVIPTLSAAVRVTGALSATAALAAEKRETTVPIGGMLIIRQQKLHHVGSRLFVLWDKHLQRGWLVGGDTAALHLFRVYGKKNSDLKDFDFMSLKSLGSSASSAYEVLAELNEYAGEQDKKDKEDKEDKKDKKDKKPVIGPYLDEIYAILLEFSAKTPDLNKTHALSTPFQMWLDKKCGTTITGCDFDEITGSISTPQVYNYKMKKDPGWLQWTKEEKVTFLFASGLGEILEPKAGSCCPYFPTLPPGQNFLASNLRTLKRLITKYGANESCFPPDKTVARLSRDQGWERRLDPFSRPKCQGDHLSTLGPSCFPVQGTLSAQMLQDTDEILKKDQKLLKSKALYTTKEINDMIDKNPNGVVVFGRQPGPEQLKNICQRSRQSTSQSEKQPTASSTSAAAQSSDRPSSRDSASGSTASTPRPPPVTEQNRTEKPSSALTQRTPSINSITSTGSSTHSKVLRGNSSGSGQPQASTSQSPPNLVHKTASNASLRSNNSATRFRVLDGGRSHEPTAASNAPIATRKPSNSSVRTTSSVASRATGGSQPREASAEASNAGLKKTMTNSSDKTTSSHSSRASQPSDLGLKKTITNSSDKTTSSHSSRTAQNLAAFNNNRQRQQLLEQVGNTTATAGSLAPGQPASSSHGTSSGVTTENPHSTSSGPPPTASGGPEVSS